MTTDNRTNEPTEAQVEAAAKAIYEVRPNGDIEWGSAEFDEWMERGDYHTKARAAPEAAARAAQGAAPQDNGECGGCRGLGSHRNVLGCDYYEAPVPPSSTRENALDLLEHFRVNGQIDYEDYSTMHYHITSIAPVLPSGCVDEDALAEVIDAALDKWEGYEPSVVFVARAVAAWLKGQER